MGTSQQQLRKQYDDKLDENQIKKLLMGKKFFENQKINCSSRLRHPRNTLIKKYIEREASKSSSPHEINN